MTIKEASEATGISTDNLRYYERIGLIPSVPRTEAGIRNYSALNIEWIEFVMRFKNAGVPLEGIVEYMTLSFEGAKTAEARMDLLVETRDAIREKLGELQSCLDQIQYKIDNYYTVCLPKTEELIHEWKENNKI